jgi:hypothetical protein
MQAVTKATGMAEAAELSLPFFETSAASGHNIEEAFLELAKLMKQRSVIAAELVLPCTSHR